MTTWMFKLNWASFSAYMYASKPLSYVSAYIIPVSILRKSISDRHRPVRVADGPMTVRYRFT